VAARYPGIDAGSGKLLNLEGRINGCRSERQGAEPFRYESEELLSITAYVARQSRGLSMRVDIDGPARRHFETGRAIYYQRIGQMNLACAHCHEANWGKTLRAETISQGQPIGYPAYRLEWQTMGSLERRLRACFSGVRAEMLPYGAQEHRDLELFLAWRAQGLAIETPGVRR
jgi:sulfur-oxidizing protein SoxA